MTHTLNTTVRNESAAEFPAEIELARLRQAIDEAAIIAVTDPAGRIIFANDAFCKISKYAREELVGRNHRIINSGLHSPKFFDDMWATISAGRVWKGQIRNRAKDRSLYWVDTTIVPFTDADGKPREYLSIRFDITERKRIEEELRAANKKIVDDHAMLLQAEKLSSIGLLAAGVAHEINNPLGGVMNCIKTLKEGSLSPERSQQYFEVVQDGLQRIKNIVQSLLGYARPNPSFAPVDLAEVVRRTLPLLSPVARKRNVSILVNLPDNTCTIDGDQSQLSQAIMNILLNAIQASQASTAIEVDDVSDAGRIGLRIRDHGCGIEPTHLSKICDPFFSTKPRGEGTGLGLSVTLGIVQANGGELAFDSTVGEGTDVFMWFKRKPPAATPPSEPLPA